MSDITFAWSARRFERAWLHDALLDFAERGLITDVLFPVRSGKEATVYACAAHPSVGVDLVAAKVYHPPNHRTLSRDGKYREGRDLITESGHVTSRHKMRTAKAVRKNTRYGRAVKRSSWLHHEVAALQTLHAAGCPVPRHLATGRQAILMSFVGDRDGAAPTLHACHLDPETTRRVFDQVFDVIVEAWGRDWVHGDLSAYNVLFWEGAPVVIDWPQVTHRWRNPNAYDLLVRDVDRMVRWAVRHGVDVDTTDIMETLWPAEHPDLDWFLGRAPPD